MVAMTVHTSEGDIIAVDEKHCETSSVLKSALYHENGHCATGMFYDKSSSVYFKMRCEYIADKYVANNWITKEMIEKAHKEEGIEYIWEFAEYFNITIEYMKRIFYIHFQTEFPD